MTTKEDILNFAILNREVNLIPYLLSVGLAKDKFLEVICWVNTPANRLTICRNYVKHISSDFEISQMIAYLNLHGYNIDFPIALELLSKANLSERNIDEIECHVYGNTREAHSLRNKIISHPNTSEKTLTKIGKKSSKCLWEIIQKNDVTTDIVKRVAKLVCHGYWNYYKNKYETLVRLGKISKKTQDVITDLLNIKDILE